MQANAEILERDSLVWTIWHTIFFQVKTYQKYHFVPALSQTYLPTASSASVMKNLLSFLQDWSSHSQCSAAIFPIFASQVSLPSFPNSVLALQPNRTEILLLMQAPAANAKGSPAAFSYIISMLGLQPHIYYASAVLSKRLIWKTHMSVSNCVLWVPWDYSQATSEPTCGCQGDQLPC